MKKNILLLLLLFIFQSIMLIPNKVLADSATSTIIMDINSGRILYSKNIHEKRLIASITKIMTCIIVLENENIEKKIIVGDEINESYGTNIYLEEGEEITFKDLLYGLMLRSGNDAALTLASHTFNNRDEFIKKMNEKAKKIGMKNTNFQNPHGLDETTKNYSTAYDMALLSKYAYQNEKYKKIISTKKYLAKSSIKSYIWYNRMNLINSYKNCIGGKNGYTPSAGKTLVSLAKKNNITLTMVSLNDQDLYNNHKKLYEKYFSQYKNYTILKKQKTIIKSKLFSGKLYIKKEFIYPLKENEISNIKTIVEIYPNSNKDAVGKIIITLDNKTIGKRNIYQQKKKRKNSSKE